jgi:hypothetical protein
MITIANIGTDKKEAWHTVLEVASSYIHMQARTSVVKEQEQTIVLNLSNGEELAVGSC